MPRPCFGICCEVDVCGFKFRRQYPICGYIVDFYCHAANLVIELDGGGHNAEDQRLQDAERTKILEAVGIRVLRFWNHEVLTSLENVLAEIHENLKAGESVSPSSGLRPPSPSREKGY